MDPLQLALTHIATILAALGAFFAGLAALLTIKRQNKIILEIHQQTNGALATLREEMALLLDLRKSMTAHQDDTDQRTASDQTAPTPQEDTP